MWGLNPLSAREWRIGVSDPTNQRRNRCDLPHKRISWFLKLEANSALDSLDGLNAAHYYDTEADPKTPMSR